MRPIDTIIGIHLHRVYVWNHPCPLDILNRLIPANLFLIISCKETSKKICGSTWFHICMLDNVPFVMKLGASFFHDTFYGVLGDKLLAP